MSIEALIFSTAAIIVISAVVMTIHRNNKMKEMLGLLEFAQNQIDELQDAIIRNRDSHDMSHRRVSDQSRRIAWLESKIRKPKLSPDEVLDDSVITEQPKLSMTERRHRVINLASRGKSAETIAASLGLFKGEVELILSLNRAALGQR